MTRRRWLSVPVSVALHGLVLVAVVALLRPAPDPLFVDLTRDADSPSGAAGARDHAAAGGDARAPRAPVRSRPAATATSPVAAARGPAPGPLSEPVPAPVPAAAPTASAPTSRALTPSESPPPVREAPVPPASRDAAAGTPTPDRAPGGVPRAVDGGGPVALVAPGAADGTGRGEAGGSTTRGADGGVATDAGSALGRGGSSGGALALALPGDGQERGAGDYARYLSEVRRRIQESLQYPASALRRGLRGTVHLEIEVAASGAIARVTVIASSSHRLLDEAALDAARALPRIPFPPDLSPRPLRARLPIVFELR